MADVLEINALTGEEIERGYNNAEKAQRAQDKKDQQAADEAKLAQQIADQAAADAAYAHAKTLGFTDDMLRMMFPGYVIPKDPKDAAV
jgi:hypothetical protein